jgi:hypothetical protein
MNLVNQALSMVMTYFQTPIQTPNLNNKPELEPWQDAIFENEKICQLISKSNVLSAPIESMTWYVKVIFDGGEIRKQFLYKKDESQFEWLPKVNQLLKKSVQEGPLPSSKIAFLALMINKQEDGEILSNRVGIAYYERGCEPCSIAHKVIPKKCLEQAGFFNEPIDEKGDLVLGEYFENTQWIQSIENQVQSTI